MLTLIKVVKRSHPNAEGRWLRAPNVDLGLTWFDYERALSPWIPSDHFLAEVDLVGIERDHAFRTSWGHDLLYRLAWPSYECQLCVGQDEWAGCYCDYHGGAGPGVEPEAWRLWARRLWSVVARRCGVHDPGRK